MYIIQETVRMTPLDMSFRCFAVDNTSLSCLKRMIVAASGLRLVQNDIDNSNISISQAAYGPGLIELELTMASHTSQPATRQPMHISAASDLHEYHPHVVSQNVRPRQCKHVSGITSGTVLSSQFRQMMSSSQWLQVSFR